MLVRAELFGETSGLEVEKVRGACGKQAGHRLETTLGRHLELLCLKVCSKGPLGSKRNTNLEHKQVKAGMESGWGWK